MLAFLRRVFVGSWLGRVLAVLIFLSFAAWGMGGFFSDLFSGGVGAGNVAEVGGRSITGPDLERVYRRGLASAAQNQHIADPLSLPYPEKRYIADAALRQLEAQAAIAVAANRIGLVVPDALLRQRIIDEKAFAGPNGQFDRAVFEQRLQNAGMTQDQLVDALRGEAQANALMQPVRIGVRAPAELVRRAFDYASEQRVLDMRIVPFATTPPPAPDESVLRRVFDNNRSAFTAPEYRRIKLVLLSPATIARTVDVSDAEERRAYDELITRYQVPEKRSVRILIAPDEAKATQIAAAWRAGAGWADLQKPAYGATPIELDDATQNSIPSPDLAKQVFAAQTGAVTGPVKLDAGWVVLEVSKVTPPLNRSFDQVKDELRALIGKDKAQNLIAPRVQKLQDAIAGGGLDSIPADLGADAAEGTLDAQGLTPAGEPAPLPGSDAVRKAVIAQAFKTPVGQAPSLTQGPDGSWFALAVESITPAAQLSFVQAAEKVRAFWQQQQVRHDAEEQAASLLHNAQAQHGVAAASAGQPGLQVGLTVRRGQTDGPVPANVAQLAFSLKQGETTMLEVPDGFAVLTLTAIRHPDPATEKLAYQRLSYALDGAIADDVEQTYLNALLKRAGVKDDPKAIDALVGPATGSGTGATGDSGAPT
ncbi:peptidyl-prolyl cis-trans isomerase [Acetobacteraceae bacterium KSS8]|uniref:Parvulin-like PPIase n=1 Tax=Endosaccharibacter trunci TaxID=2812733 RepID=A0ABT1W364_9PROT|nr:peptidyl-prolyl cis-trans isomerase [Acetobacteraceae bacterium KSS8]